jgi:hypothetical protein
MKNLKPGHDSKTEDDIVPRGTRNNFSFSKSYLDISITFAVLFSAQDH